MKFTAGVFDTSDLSLLLTISANFLNNFKWPPWYNQGRGPVEIVSRKNLKLKILLQTLYKPTLFHKIRENEQIFFFKYQHHLKNLKPAAVLIRPAFINPFMREKAKLTS
jgi:hypothetical protein